MVIDENQIFNLMDTNGRRSDVLNALQIYLEILEELKDEYPTEEWNTYPNSIAQFLFYERALEKSKDVFKIHKNYDKFIEELGDAYQDFLCKDSDWTRTKLPQMAKMLDEAIEKRARHYTSNLVKMGFTDAQRNITEAGCSYLRGCVNKDSIENILPIDSVNIALLRQLSKLKIFSNPAEGKRQFYSPFLMALALLLNGESIDRDSFEVIVQGLSPYSDEAIKAAVLQSRINIEELKTAIQNIMVEVPTELEGEVELNLDLVKKYFKSSKSNEATSQKYYNLIIALENFRENQCDDNYAALLNCFEQDGTVLYKAFGYGKAVFEMGNRGSRYDMNTFLEENRDHHLLTAEDYIREIYVTFSKSKWIDGIREYSDTTMRLLSATGLFQFRNLPSLSCREVLSLIFDISALKQGIFGEMTEEEYREYEVKEGCYFGKSNSLADIFNFSTDDVSAVIEKIEAQLMVSSSDEVKTLLYNNKNAEFINHINAKYPKKKIMELLPLFSDRRNDLRIKREVNDAATVPTIYEYIVAIAWYYISNKDFDLYGSMNLTLNADFEPVIHAGAGEGDIVISYDDMVIMLEVTLMNKQAQKRGEWEPVLRHSLNLKAANESKETITFFIADELDPNTINIWRAVAAVPLESTNTHQAVNGVVIMPFINHEIGCFLEQNVTREEIVEKVKSSFAKVPQITDVKWHEDIIRGLVT
ncbi:MAG: AlwI family type II restriction endonuclease [Lachnospiraceae bacterium]|nr:AlwI family type II restriction endonuclease [Lachnospiraceae bacterium]